MSMSVRGCAALVVLAVLAVLSPAAAASVGAATRSTVTPHGFTHPLRIHNPYYSLRPLTRYRYVGRVVDAQGRHRHRVVFTVTDLVKRVGGHETRVAWDRDIEDGVLSEAELALFAQDDRGDVVSLGEYPQEFEDGVLQGAPSTWVSGIGDGRGGVLVPGDPQVGTRFVEGEARSIDFFDVGRVVSRDARTCVPIGCFRHVLVVDEWSPLAPEDGHQLKYYAPGFGLVSVAARGGDSRETMTLHAVVHLGRAAALHARRVVRRMDRQGRTSSAVWGRTDPVHLPAR